MRRRIFAILATLSLVICVAVVVLWVRSYWFYDHWVLETWDDRAHYTAIQLCQGSLRGISTDADRWPIGKPVSPRRTWQFAGFGVRWAYVLVLDPSRHGPVNGPMTIDPWDVAEGFPYSGPSPPGIFIRIPCWFPALAFACLPAWWLIAALRQRRAGLCPVCGYDLRASKDTCPECGAAISVEEKKAGTM